MKAALRAAFPASAAPVGAAYRACRPDPARSAPPSSRWLRAGLLAGRVPARRRTSTRPALRPPPPNSPDSSTAPTCSESPPRRSRSYLLRARIAGSVSWYVAQAVDGKQKRVRLLTMCPELKISQVDLHLAEQKTPRRPHVECRFAFRATPHIRDCRGVRCPDGRYQPWHSVAILH